jgi:hypothetical protein
LEARDALESKSSKVRFIDERIVDDLEFATPATVLCSERKSKQAYPGSGAPKKADWRRDPSIDLRIGALFAEDTQQAASS